ncbi:unnamed protein product, partial [Prorocentrum cordatum]
QLKVAERIMWKKGPSHREYARTKEAEKRDEEFARQGRILAEALAPGLQAAMASAVTNTAPTVEFPPPPPQTAPTSGSSGAAPAGAVAPVGTAPEVLTPLQRHLICAELDHKAKLTEGTLEELIKEIGSKWSQRAVAQRLDEGIKRMGGPTTK